MNNSELIDLLRDVENEFKTYCYSRICTYDDCAINRFRKDNDAAGIDCKMIFIAFKIIGENIDNKGEKK